MQLRSLVGLAYYRQGDDPICVPYWEAERVRELKLKALLD
jgi:hypothetical protein